MIVLSGILVVVAAILLVTGLVRGDDDGGTTLVYASIGVSVVSAILLLVSVYLRRGEDVDEGESATAGAGPSPFAPARSTADEGEGVTAVLPGGSRRATGEADAPAPRPAPARPAPAARQTLASVATPDPADDADIDDEPAVPPATVPAAGATSGRTVLVVEGRPRYHVEGCRYLAGKTSEPRDLDAARAEGFSACGVCKPDRAVAATAAEPAAPADATETPVAVDTDLATAPVTTSAEQPSDAPRARTVRRVTPPAPDAAAAKAPAPVKASPAKSTVSKRAAARPAETPSAAMEALSPTRTSVVVIPDRDKYHRAECRYVRSAGDTKTMTKSTARRQGFSACGTCKP